MITDDATLVNMALDGKREAFDELVKRHRSKVVSAARLVVGSADGAEDVAQQAFCAAFTNLPLLREPASFRPWLIAITRRCAARQWRTQSRETTGLDGCVVASPYLEPMDHAVTEARIAELLAELSALNRRALVMHYLEGRSCREIGEHLAIPTGTVKRILHESRNSLRASSQLRGGQDGMSNNSQGPRKMTWWINGQWPGEMMYSVLRQSICLTINKSGLTPEQIAKRIDANEVYVREELDALEAEELVEKIGRGRYRNSFVVLSAEDWIALSQEIRAKSERVGDLLAEALPELQAAWDDSPKPQQEFDWGTGIWPVLAIMVCNTGLFRAGAVETGPAPPIHSASGKRYWAGGREEVAQEYVLWGTGFSLNSRPTGLSCGHFWSYGLPFGTRRFGCSGDHRLLFGAVASGFRDIDSAAKAAEIDIERAREAAASAIEQGLLEQTDDGLALTFPVFRSEDESALLPTVDRVCARLAQELDCVARLVDERLPELGFGQFEAQFGTWRGWLRGDAAGEGLRVLYDRGLLPHPEDPAPANFCMAGWFNKQTLFAFDREG